MEIHFSRARSCYCGGSWETINHLGSCATDLNPKVLRLSKDQCNDLIDHGTYTLSYSDRYHTIKNISINDGFYYSKVSKTQQVYLLPTIYILFVYPE